MTRSIESVGTTITITTTSSIAPAKSNTEPVCIGFLPSYLPNQDPPPYPLDVPPVIFPTGYSPNMSSRSSSYPPYPLDVTLVDKVPPPYPSKNSLNNEARHDHLLESKNSNKTHGDRLSMTSSEASINTSLVHCEKKEIMIALSQLKCKSLWKSDEEKKEFVKAQNKVADIINDPKSCLSTEEKESFQRDVQEINEARNKYLKEQKVENIVEVNGTEDNEIEDRRTKCSFDVTTLLLKIPQLLVDVIICIKGGMSGITTAFGAMFFTLSLTAGLFTTYYLILYCICKITKRSRITEFLHSFVCTLSFFFLSFYSTDSDLMVFGFLAMVPYGCEVCWTSWNFIKEEKSRLFPHL